MFDPACSRPPTLKEALASLGLQDAVPESVINQATDTLVWRVSHHGWPLAIRVLRKEQQPVMAAELAAMRLAEVHGVPAPGVVASGLIAGREPVMALTWMPGNPIAESIPRQPVLAQRLGLEAGRMLARIHRIPVGALPELSASWIRLGTLDDSSLGAQLRTLSAGRRSLLHLDYHPFNLLATGGRLSGVVDWTNTAIGDPRADIARTIAILRVVAPAIRGRRGARRMAIGRFARGFLAGYVRSNGRLEDMAPFYAWAGGMLMRDLGPKIDSMPVYNPDAFRARIEAWTAQWKRRAGQT